ncbi:unnamed protein product, partial [Didymodactylos carnosus]
MFDSRFRNRNEKNCGSEEIAAGNYDHRDIQRFNEIDDYTNMFIQHAQFSEKFNEQRALEVFNLAMIWRKNNSVYDISPNIFPENYFDRGAIFFKHFDLNNNPILNFVVKTFHKGEEDNEMVKRFIIYHLERHIRRSPEQKIVFLFDMSETGLKHLDFDIVRFIIACVQTNFPNIL